MIGLPFRLTVGLQAGLQVACVALLSVAASSFAQTPVPQFSGMVWERHGDWHINGSSNSVRLGEAVPPGSLLTGGVSDSTHSLVILMPDGQHLLCECFDAQTCNQGFRAPSITPPPAPAVWNTFVAVRNILLLRPATAEAAFPAETGRESLVGRREVVAAITASEEISLAPALRDLPSGSYALTVTRDDGRDVPAAPQVLDWDVSRGTASLRIDGVGLYRIRVSDPRKTSRLDIEVLAAPPAAQQREAAGLTTVRKTVQQWSTTNPGWSLHDFLRAYLQSRAIALAAS